MADNKLFISERFQNLPFLITMVIVGETIFYDVCCAFIISKHNDGKLLFPLEEEETIESSLSDDEIGVHYGNEYIKGVYMVEKPPCSI